MEYRVYIKERVIMNRTVVYRPRDDIGLLVQADTHTAALSDAGKQLKTRLGSGYKVISINHLVNPKGGIQAIVEPNAGPVMPQGATVGHRGLLGRASRALRTILGE